MQQIGFLHFSHVEQWRKGNPYYETLEPHIQCGEKKLQTTYRHFFEWVDAKKLKPFEASHAAATRHGDEPLRITESGDPELEAFFRTQFRSASLPSAKKKRIEKKANKRPELLVYQITSRSSQRGGCDGDLSKGEMLFLEQGEPLCLFCADLDHLEFLPSGDAALTRRSRKHSPLSAIVLRFSRTRKRYERQGILATPHAIAQAEAECASDADERAARRLVDAERHREQDRELVDDMTSLILQEFPNGPPDEARQIAEHTAVRGSGRVGRSAAGRALDLDAITLAVGAWIRHQHTDYDALLMQGVDRLDARERIRGNADEVRLRWH